MPTLEFPRLAAADSLWLEFQTIMSERQDSVQPEVSLVCRFAAPSFDYW